MGNLCKRKNKPNYNSYDQSSYQQPYQQSFQQPYQSQQYNYPQQPSYQQQPQPQPQPQPPQYSFQNYQPVAPLPPPKPIVIYCDDLYHPGEPNVCELYRRKPKKEQTKTPLPTEDIPGASD